MEIVGWMLFTLGTCCFCIGLLTTSYEINITVLLLITIGFVGVGSGYILICTAANEKTQNNVSKAETLVIKNIKTTFYNNFDKIVIK